MGTKSSTISGDKVIEQQIKQYIRDIRDFPKEGIVFKDITPLLGNPELCSEVTKAFVKRVRPLDIAAVVGIESRGFLFGMLLAHELQVPFVPIRKEGKLPASTVNYSYSLEYGTATIEMHEDALSAGQRVLIHDDLLATGGTATAAAEMVVQQEAEIAGFAFLITLGFLEGRQRLQKYSDQMISLANYD